MLERRRARSTSRRIEPLDPRRDSSFWMPALRAAAAASECGGVWETVGDCDMVREGSVGVCDAILVCRGEAEGEGEGGSELRSGGIALRAEVGERYTMAVLGMTHRGVNCWGRRRRSPGRWRDAESRGRWWFKVGKLLLWGPPLVGRPAAVLAVAVPVSRLAAAAGRGGRGPRPGDVHLRP